MDAAASGSDHTVAPYGGNGHGDMTDGSADTAHGGVADGSSPYGPSVPAVSTPAVSTHAPAKKRRCFLSAALDTTRINRDVQNYVEEIIRHLTSEDGTRVTISLEVEAESDNGFSPQTIRTVSENARTLGAKDAGFEE